MPCRSASDFIYNPRTKSYHPAEPKLDTKGHIEYSGSFPVDEGLPSDHTSTVTLPVTAPLPNTVSVVHVLGVAFFQRVASIYYPLDDGPALKVLEVI
jgi:hypothetical protein